MAGQFRSPFRIKVRDLNGFGYGSYDTFQSLSWSPELNHWGSVHIDVPTTSECAAACVPGREIQLWYDPPSGTPRCLEWGPIITREADDRGSTAIQAYGSEWYLSQMQLGPVLNEYLLDPEFEDATLFHWTAGGSATKSSETTIVRKGTRSMKLVSSGTGADDWAAQEFVYDNSASSQAVAFFVAGRAYLVATTGTPYVGPAFQERGLYVKRIQGGVDQVETTGIVGKWATINNSVARNQWVRVFAPPVTIPAGVVQTIHVRPYAIGTCYWDTMTARVQESGGANTPSGYADVNTILANLLAYGQDSVNAHKLNLHINGPTPGSFGKSLSRQFQYFLHGKLWDAAIQPLIDAGICDVAITWDAAATQRTLNTFAAGRGSYKPELALVLGSNALLSSHRQDLSETARTVTVLPQGMADEPSVGIDQPVCGDVGYAYDSSSTSPVELVVNVVPEGTLDTMAGQATTELARRSSLVQGPAWNADADKLLAGGLAVGDTIPFRGKYGWIDESANRRVVTMTLTAPNVLTVTGN